MIIREITDPELIKEVLFHPAIFPHIGGKAFMNGCDIPINSSYQYIGGFVEKKIIALGFYHDIGGEVKCHIQVLPEYRKEYAKRFAKLALDFGKGKNTDLFAEVPEQYQNVIDFGKSIGFYEDGRSSDGKIILRYRHGNA